jgi:hypothetical protein
MYPSESFPVVSMNFGSMCPASWARMIFGFQSSSFDVRVNRMASDWY